MMDEAHLKILVPYDQAEEVHRLLSRRQVLAAGAAGALGLMVAGCGSKSSASRGTTSVASGAKLERSLLIGNWADYSDPASYTAYTKAFGPKITVDTYDSNNAILAKLNAGGSNYDIVVPAGFMVKILVEKKLALELNHDLLPNLKNLRGKFRQGAYDPGNRYSVPKDFGITSFFYRTAVVKDRPKTLREVLDMIPKYRDARVNFIEEPSDVSEVVLAALGKNTSTTDPKDFQEALDLLKRLRPYVDTLDTNYQERAIRGQIDIGMAWNGDGRKVIQERKKQGDEVIYVVPTTNGVYWVDNWLIPAAAKDPVAAHRWINYMLEPQAAGREMNYHQYAVPVTGVDRYVSKALAHDPVINIGDSTLKTYQTADQSAQRLKLGADLFTEFRNA